MEAIADYRVVEGFKDTSLIEVRLRTGRRNQIRIQARFAAIRSSANSGTSTGRTRCGRSPSAARPCTPTVSSSITPRTDARWRSRRPFGDLVDLLTRLRRARN